MIKLLELETEVLEAVENNDEKFTVVCKYLYLKPILNSEGIESYTGGVKFHYFDIVDEIGKIIEQYDYLDIGEGVRIDVVESESENGDKCFRLYPTWCYNRIKYDTVHHKVVGIKEKEK